MKKATIILDSRERKALYDHINISSPIVLHDPHGVEVVTNKHRVFQVFNRPVGNLNVNGAGDIYAAFLLNNYHKLGLFESVSHAVTETTNLLINRIQK